MKEERETICRIVRADSLEPLFPLLDGYGAVWIVCDCTVWDSVGRLVAERLAGEPLSSCGRSAGMGKLLGISLIDASEENKTMAKIEGIAGLNIQKRRSFRLCPDDPPCPGRCRSRREERGELPFFQEYAGNHPAAGVYLHIS